MADNIIELIRRLIAHQESAQAIGSLAEAQAFAEKIQKLLLEHKLDRDAIDVETEEPYDRQFLKNKDLGAPPYRIDVWAQVLLMAVAKAHFCHIIFATRKRWDKGEGQLWVVGRASDREVTKTMFRFLYRACLEMSNKDAWRYAGAAAQRYRKSFGAGFAHAIRSRTEDTVKALAESADQRGLVLINKEAEALATYIKSAFDGLQSSTVRPCVASADGYHAGKKYGSEIGLTSNKCLTA